jgi:hypothetical protein
VLKKRYTYDRFQYAYTKHLQVVASFILQCVRDDRGLKRWGRQACNGTPPTVGTRLTLFRPEEVTYPSIHCRMLVAFLSRRFSWRSASGASLRYPTEPLHTQNTSAKVVFLTIVRHLRSFRNQEANNAKLEQSGAVETAEIWIGRVARGRLLWRPRRD